MPRFCVILLFFFLIVGGCQNTIHRHENPNLVMVSEVLSADKIKLTDGRIIRYLGIEAPKIGEFFYTQAFVAHRDLLENQWVLIKEETKDNAGNILAHVFLFRGGSVYTYVNVELIEYGCAKVRLKDPINEKFRALLLSREDKAKKERRGVWGKDGN